MTNAKVVGHYGAHALFYTSFALNAHKCKEPELFQVNEPLYISFCVTYIPAFTVAVFKIKWKGGSK